MSDRLGRPMPSTRPKTEREPVSASMGRRKTWPPARDAADAPGPDRGRVSLDDVYGTSEGRALMSGIQAIVRLVLEQRRLDRPGASTPPPSSAGTRDHRWAGSTSSCGAPHPSWTRTASSSRPGSTRSWPPPPWRAPSSSAECPGTATTGWPGSGTARTRARPGGRRHPPRQLRRARRRSAARWPSSATTRPASRPRSRARRSPWRAACIVPLLAPARSPTSSASGSTPSRCPATPACGPPSRSWPTSPTGRPWSISGGVARHPRRPTPSASRPVHPLLVGPGRLEAEEDLVDVRLPAGARVRPSRPALNRSPSSHPGPGWRSWPRARPTPPSSGPSTTSGWTAGPATTSGCASSGSTCPGRSTRRPAADCTAGLDEVLVVEDKAPFIESQLKDALYRQRHSRGSCGKDDREGRPLIPRHGAVDNDIVARVLARACSVPTAPGRGRAPSTATTPAPRAPGGCTRCAAGPRRRTSARAAPTTSRPGPTTTSWSGWASGATSWRRSTTTVGATRWA